MYFIDLSLSDLILLSKINDFLLIGMLIIVTVFVFINYRNRILDLFLALSISAAISEVLKFFVNIPRPLSDIIFEGSSFPSTHTTVAFCALFFYTFACRPLSYIEGRGEGVKSVISDANRAFKYFLISLLIIMAVLVGSLRWIVNAHYIIDIFAGAAIGLAIAMPFRFFDVMTRRIK